MANTERRDAWLAVVDSERARLLRATPTEHRLHLDEAAQLATTFHAGGPTRPALVGQPGRHASTGHVHEAKLAHFAREAATWLERELLARGIDRCAVFAPTHVLGALRPQLGKQIAGRLHEQAGELAQLGLPELARHPRVVAWCSAKPQ